MEFSAGCEYHMHRPKVVDLLEVPTHLKDCPIGATMRSPKISLAQVFTPGNKETLRITLTTKEYPCRLLYKVSTNS